MWDYCQSPNLETDTSLKSQGTWHWWCKNYDWHQEWSDWKTASPEPTSGQYTLHRPPFQNRRQQTYQHIKISRRPWNLYFYHFKKSPKKVEALHAVQSVLEEPAIKYREIHEIRWLSTYDAITSLYRTLDSFITYCSNSDNLSATGLRKKVATTMFISVLYSMMDILRPIMELSLVVQTKDLDIGKVKVCLN